MLIVFRSQTKGGHS